MGVLRQGFQLRRRTVVFLKIPGPRGEALIKIIGRRGFIPGEQPLGTPIKTGFTPLPFLRLRRIRITGGLQKLRFRQLPG